MKRPGKPREIGKSFSMLLWDNGQVRFKTFQDVLKTHYTDEIMQKLILRESFLDLLVPRVSPMEKMSGSHLAFGLKI